MKRWFKRVDLYVFGLFALISVSCVIIFLLPADMQELLKARSDDWNLLSFWASTFVHSNFEHLLGNVTSFLLLGFIVFKMNRKSGREKEFLCSLIIAIIVLPFIDNISFMLLANFVIRRIVVSCGLSTIVASLAGLIVPSLGIFLREPLQSERNTLCLLVSFMLLTGSSIAFPYVDSSLYNLMVFVATLVFGLILLIHVGKILVNFAKQNQRARKTILAASITVYVYFIFIFTLFPSKITMPEGGIVNIFSHHVGIFYGMITGIYTLNIFPKRKN
jgi:protein-S-isoprenylcysteine O-methyltransferase Ste14